MLQDNFGRRFSYLRLSITDVCNFRCNYCLPDGYECENDRDFISLNEIKRISNAFAQLGTEKIRITGGEPSLRKDLPQIIETCKKTDGIKTVALTSNGYKLTQQLPIWLDAGLDALNISIDSFDARQFHTITGSNKLDTILSGIENGLVSGFENIKINTVLMKEHNAHDLHTFFNYVKDKPVSLRFIELMQTGDNKDFYQQQHVSGQHIKNQLLVNGWAPIIRHKNAGPAQEFAHPNYQGTIGLIMPYEQGFCDTCNRLRISALGKLHLCLFSEEGLSIREHLQDDNIDSVKEALTSLLGNKKATHFLHEGFTGATKHLSMLGG